MKFIFGVFSLIIGVALFKLFDFENMKFENIGLAIVYMVGLAISIYAIVKNLKGQPEK